MSIQQTSTPSDDTQKAQLMQSSEDFFAGRKAKFRDFYNENLQNFTDACDSISNIISILTKELPSGRPKVISRIKDREECIRKFERKYRTEVEKRGGEYNIQDHISDLIGIRIVCLYEDDVKVVQRIISENFDVTEVTDKTEKLVIDSAKFGYRGLHLDMQLGDSRSNLPENNSIKGLNFEVQIRSIVQDAWSEIDHRLKYKKSIPDKLKRRISRLAALFELADQEFSEIRKNTEQLETLLSVDDDAAIEAGLTNDRIIDSFSFIAAMKTYFGAYNFENEPQSESARKIDGFVEEIRRMNPRLTDLQFKNLLAEVLPVIQPYVTSPLSTGRRMNPFTVVRHVLFWSDPHLYGDALFARQTESFLRWKEEIPIPNRDTKDEK